MSRSTYAELDCDLQLSSQCWEHYGPERTLGEAVRGARAAGWRVGRAADEADACPECRAEQEGRATAPTH